MAIARPTWRRSSGDVFSAGNCAPMARRYWTCGISHGRKSAALRIPVGWILRWTLSTRAKDRLIFRNQRGAPEGGGNVFARELAPPGGAVDQVQTKSLLELERPPRLAR